MASWPLGARRCLKYILVAPISPTSSLPIRRLSKRHAEQTNNAAAHQNDSPPPPPPDSAHQVNEALDLAQQEAKQRTGFGWGLGVGLIFW